MDDKIYGENYVIWDRTEGKVFSKPHCRIMSKEFLIERLPKFKTIWNFLAAFENSGYVANITRHYRGQFKRGPKEGNFYDFDVEYNMFGAYADNENTDDAYGYVDCGIYIQSSSAVWCTDRDVDFFLDDSNIYSFDDLKKHLRTFCEPVALPMLLTYDYFKTL